MTNTHTLTNFGSLNVQGLRDKSKRMRFKEYIMQQKFDIIFIQETHFTSEMSNLLNLEFDNFTQHHAYGTSQSKGCSILISNNCQLRVTDSFYCDEGRYVLLNTNVGDSYYSVLNVYAPNEKQNRNTFFKNIDNLLNEKSFGIKLLGGDFNEILNETDRISKTKISCKPCENLLNIIKKYSLVDIWKDKNQTKQQYTWRRTNSLEKSRIDFWLTDKNASSQIKHSDIRPAQIKYTDHQAISLTLVTNSNRGPGVWKMNNSLLLDDEFKLLIVNKINKIKQNLSNRNISNKLIWERVKIEVRNSAIDYGKQKAKSLRDNLST